MLYALQVQDHVVFVARHLAIAAVQHIAAEVIQVGQQLGIGHVAAQVKHVRKRRLRDLHQGAVGIEQQRFAGRGGRGSRVPGWEQAPKFFKHRQINTMLSRWISSGPSTKPRIVSISLDGLRMMRRASELV